MRTSTHYCVNTAQEYSEEPSTIVAAVSGGMPARNKLLMACFKMVQKNSCRTPACEYSHDPGTVAEVHETQIADLLKAKRDLQVTHTNTMKVFEKDGARSYKQVNPSIHLPHFADHLPPTWTTTGPAYRREHECYRRIALLSRHIPANILSHGCQTEVALLCSTADLTVRAMLDTGCSPCNQQFRQTEHAAHHH